MQNLRSSHPLRRRSYFRCRYKTVCLRLFESSSRRRIHLTSRTDRYVALRWSTPTVRKKKSRAKPTLNADGTPSRRGGARAKSRTSPSASPVDTNGEPVLFREGKTLSGFILAEHDVSRKFLMLGETGAEVDLRCYRWPTV
jgi:hypothetical protein